MLLLNLKIKLQNFIERNKLDITIEDLFEKIKKDDVVASFFAKPSTKQNTSEKFVFDYQEYRKERGH
jgi:hypothetical protein